MERRIRELQAYGYDDDADSSVQIQALPGSTVNGRASQPDSDAPERHPRWVTLAAKVVGAAMTLAGIAKVIWEATR